MSRNAQAAAGDGSWARRATSPFPPYRAPTGGPHYWMDETSGVLCDAVEAYLHGHETPAQFALMRDYCRHWIEAPCWRDDAAGMLARLRREVREVRDRAGLSRWLDEALGLGIDPF